MQITGNQLREAATFVAAFATLWAGTLRLLVWLFFVTHQMAAFVFNPGTAAFSYSWQLLMGVGFFGSLILVTSVYRKLIYALTGGSHSDGT